MANIDPSEWVQTHGDVLFAFALSRLRDQTRAEEAVQEAFLAALRHVDQYRGDGDQGAWLMGILKRKVIDSQRSQAKQPLELDAEDGLMASLFDKTGHWSTGSNQRHSRSLDSLERAEFKVIFEKCLRALPENQAKVFALKEIEEQSSEEVCQYLGISSSNLWVLMHRARIRLAECLRTRWEASNV